MSPLTKFRVFLLVVMLICLIGISYDFNLSKRENSISNAIKVSYFDNIRSNGLVHEETFKYNEASNAVGIAMLTREEEDIVNAKELVASISNKETKEELIETISKIEETYEEDNLIREIVTLTSSVDNLEMVSKIEALIEKISVIDIKNDLANDLNNRRQDLLVNDINNRLNKVKNNKKQNELDEVKKIISQIVNKNIKSNFEKEVSNIQSSINKSKVINVVGSYSPTRASSAVVETVKGDISAYGPDCDGCVGYTAAGRNVMNGNIYYYDKTYGNIRIVAAGPEYPFGTIVKMKNVSYYGGDIYAIVLDRGGVIGKGRYRLFDLLFTSEESASNFGVSRNTECEILRTGY